SWRPCHEGPPHSDERDSSRSATPNPAIRRIAARNRARARGTAFDRATSTRSGDGVRARRCRRGLGVAGGGPVIDGAGGSIADEGRVRGDGGVVATVDDGDVTAQAAGCVAELLYDISS